jgi:hypothetical protein
LGLLLASTFFFYQCELIDPVDLPILVFLDALIQQGVDKKGDGIIRRPEAEAIVHLDVRGYNMQD